MELREAIATRRSVRAYRPDVIAPDVLHRVLEAARAAPSANNMQPWKFIVVREESLRRQLVSACFDQAFIGEAPIVLVACGLPTRGGIGGYASSMPVDVAIAVDHLTLAARDEGLGTCWIGAFDHDRVRALLGVPKQVHVVAITPLGCPKAPDAFRPPTGRKPLDEIVCWDRYTD
jgi:nitroreductase